MMGKYKIVDAHCHIYPEKIAEKAVAGTDAFYSTGAACKGTVADLIAEGAKAGIDHFLVHSVATTPAQVRSINEFIARAVDSSGGSMTGFGALHPDSSDIKGDIEHLTALGLKGVKLHPDIQQFAIDEDRCQEIYRICENKLPILMHTGDYRYDYSNPNRLLPVLQSYPGLTVIGAHFGGWSVYEEACDKLAGIPNLYVDCSSSMYYLSDEQTKQIIRRYGAGRVLFGSDFPMWSPSAEIRKLMALGLDEWEIECILYKNAQKLLELE